MTPKTSFLGMLIYASMGAYLAAFLLLLWRRRAAGMASFAAGFVVAAFAWAYRGVAVGHLPMRNLFEVFLGLGVLVFPLSFAARRWMRIGGEAADALIAFMLLWPAGFVFSEASQRLPPLLRSPLFGPHVATYLAAYVVIAKAAVQAAARLLRGDAPPEPGLIGRDAACWRLARLAFPLLTAGLILGAWWGRLAWADFWHWDPKELWSLATWLVFAAYLHLRATFGARFGRANAWLVMAGTGCAAATLLWANLARLFAGLHSYAA